MLDDHKDVKTDETIAVGGTNAIQFADVLGVIAERANTLVEFPQFLERSHFASTVKRVFIWADHTEPFVASSYVASLKEAVCAAAKWKHVIFVVLPMPYASGDPHRYESFMKEFNTDPPRLKNVGYPFSRSLGANEIIVDGNAIYPEGNVSRKGADAAIKFIKSLCSWLIIEATGQGPTPSSSSSVTQPVGPLHQVRGGKAEKKQKPARDVPSRGGRGGGQAHGNYCGYNKPEKHRGRGQP